MDKSLEVFIVWLKEKGIYERFMVNAHEYALEKNVTFETRGDVYAYISRVRLGNGFLWTKTMEGREFWREFSMTQPNKWDTCE